MTLDPALVELEVPAHRPLFFEELRAELRPRATRSTRRRVVVMSILIAAALAIVGGGLAAAGAFDSGPLPLETTPAAQAMANAFARPSLTVIPSSVKNDLTAMVAGAPPQDDLGKLLLNQGHELLSDLGPDGRAIYAYPTDTGQVCYDITGLGDQIPLIA